MLIVPPPARCGLGTRATNRRARVARCAPAAGWCFDGLFPLCGPVLPGFRQADAASPSYMNSE
ncbi:MAG: hypothetical protein D6725_11610 [Planctomycetota bacterium]|nr:MAG: hypothetical protein D6725_11610 [Planctomycetota bacterium]